VVGICGNLHSRLAPPTGSLKELWPSFAACLQQLNPQATVKTIDLVFHSGAIFNGGVRPIGDEPIAEAEIRAGSTSGHFLALHLPKATPATFVTAPTE
jgi:hypothetical protein